MVDLSVYKPIPTVTDYRQQNIDLNRKRQFEDEAMAIKQQQMDNEALKLEQVAQGVGGKPPAAAIQIVNEMEMSAIAAQDPNLSQRERDIAKHRYNQLNQVAKSYSIDRGMTPGIPTFGDQQMPVQDAPIQDGMQPQGIPQQPLQQPGVQEAPGYANIQERRAFETAKSKELGKSRAESQIGLSTAVDNASQMLSAIEGLETSPGFSTVIGLKNPLMGAVPFMDEAVGGTEAANALAFYDQIKGKSFLEAFNSLRGGGQITEAEGSKATNAIGRLSTSQSEKAFRAALKDLKDVVNAGLSRARGKAGGSMIDRAEQEFQGKRNNNYKSKYGLE